MNKHKTIALILFLLTVPVHAPYAAIKTQKAYFRKTKNSGQRRKRPRRLTVRIRRHNKLRKKDAKRTVIMFDLHGVLTKTNWLESTNRFLKMPHKTQFLRSLIGNKLARHVSLSNNPSYRTKAIHVINSQTLREKVVQLLKDLKKQGYTLILFSNIFSAALEDLKKDPSFAYALNLFDGYAISCEENDFTEKPSPQAFRYALARAQKINQLADKFILIDDTKSHLYAAKQYDITGIHFKSADRLRCILRQQKLL